MKLPNISKKLKEKSKLKQNHIKALETYYCFELPNNVEDFLQETKNNYPLLLDIIIKVLNYLKTCELPLVVTNEMKAKLITTIYRMVQYNAVEVNEYLIENLLRLMDA